MDGPPSISVTRPLTGFLPRWLAACVLPGCVSVPLFMGAAYLGIRSDTPALFLVAFAGALAHPVLLAIAHGRLMRGRLRRPRLWGVTTGAGFAVAVIAAATVLLNLAEIVVVATREPPPGAAEVRNVALYYAGAGLVSGVSLGLIQCTALGASLKHCLAWCVVSVLGSLAAWAWIGAWREIGVLRQLAVAIGGSLFRGDKWFEVAAVTAWIAIAVLLYALPTGFAMYRLLRRRAAAESAALAARFD